MTIFYMLTRKSIIVVIHVAGSVTPPRSHHFFIELE